MASLQANFKIEDDTYMMIQEGILDMSSGAIRWAEGEQKGQIYEIIQLDNVTKNDSDSSLNLHEVASNSIAEITEDQDNKTDIIIKGLIVAGIAIASYFGIKWWKNRKIKAFNKALKRYINDINFSSMTITSIDDLKQAIENLKRDKKYNDLKIQLSLMELDVLVKKIEEYTFELAKVNNVECSKIVDEDLDTIVSLEKYLDVQKRILNRAS